MKRILSNESGLAKLIKSITNGKAKGYYDAEKFTLIVEWFGCNKEESNGLLLKIQDHIDKCGLWNSFENVVVNR